MSLGGNKVIDEKKLVKDICNYEIKIQENYKLKPNELNAFLDGLNRKQIAVMECIFKQPRVGEWIPCSERLPKEARAVEVTMCDGNRAIGHFYKRLGAWFDSINDVAIDVIAWKEPSEPWKGGKE